MSIEKRIPEYKRINLGTGVYLAKVVGHLDASYMGGLEVTLLREEGNKVGDINQVYPVQYASPFYGSTAFEFMGNNKADFNDTQKSYGMWFVPPDVGNTVMVIFVNGRPDSGYWIACVPSRFTNHMIPGIAATTNVELSESDKKKYNTKQPLPSAEVNRRANDLLTSMEIDKVKRPVHPIADRFLEQGLLEDPVRGTTNSSARRDIPGMVYGISTPGPLDKRSGALRKNLGKKQSPSPTPVHVSRLGGTQIVMDDGDDQYQRKDKPNNLGLGQDTYADILAGEKGDPTIPFNEHFRIRTRTGHQILMHNSEDLIYIGNAKGTVWIELTSDGKIDIFAEDSISLHTKNDFNVKADRDINIEAGRNVNIKATAEYQNPDSLHNEKDIFDSAGYEIGRVQIESVQNFNLLIGRNGKIHLRNDEKIQGNLDIKVMGNMRIAVQDKDVVPSNSNISNDKIIADQPEQIKGLHIYSYENMRVKVEKDYDLNTTGRNAWTSGGTTDMKSGGNYTETAPRIDMNGPVARTASIAEIADRILELNLHQNPLTEFKVGWDDRYQDGNINSIIRRIPMHEPWSLHEHFAPTILKPKFTDREIKE